MISVKLIRSHLNGIYLVKIICLNVIIMKINLKKKISE